MVEVYTYLAGAHVRKGEPVGDWPGQRCLLLLGFYHRGDINGCMQGQVGKWVQG